MERLKGFAARHGRWLTLSPGEIDDARHFFSRHRCKAVLIGRVIPALRTLISIPAGLVEMSLPTFLLYSTIGTAIRAARRRRLPARIPVR